MTRNIGGGGAAAAEAASAMLHTLGNAPGGGELLAQIEGGKRVHAALTAAVERAFITFARNVLGRYVRTIETDGVTRQKLRLIDHRLTNLARSIPSVSAAPELPDTRTLVQHLVAQLWVAGQAAQEAISAQPATPVQLERLRPLQQALAAELDRAILANLDGIAALGSVEQTLKGVQRGELEDWREILRDSAREIIEDHRELGENLRQAQLCAAEIGRQMDAPTPVAVNGGKVSGDRPELLRRLEAEIRRAQRYRHPLSLALLGPDHLDTMKRLIGPQAPNEVIRNYIENVTSCARAYDTVTGCGSQRVLWLLPGADTDQGVLALRKARDRLQSGHFSYAGRLRPLPPFSAGIAGYASGEGPAQFLARAEVLATHARRIGPSHIERDRRRAAE